MMLRSKIIPLAWLLTAMLIIGAAVGVQARADTDDVQNYLDALDSRGITHPRGEGSLVTAGQEICNYVGGGHTPMQAAEKLYYATDSTIDSGDAGFIVGAAVANLCPEYLDLI